MPLIDTLRLVGSGGANRAMEAELKRLARRGLERWREVRPRRVDTQTLVYPWDNELGALAATYMRTPSRALHDLFECDAERLEPLYDEVLGWIAAEKRDWLKNGLRISVRARDVAVFPASGTQIQGTIKNGIIDGARARGLEVHLDAEQPDVLLSVRGTGGPLVISIDLVGRSLHERGYRLEHSEAPLRENLAAQILILARWDARSELLLDPMCGSGTFSIEGVKMALGAPIREDSTQPPLFADARPVVIANDLHTPAIDVARSNAARAHVVDRVLLLHGDFRALTEERLSREMRRHPPALWPEAPSLSRGLIVVNPPYGERLTPVDLEGLYADLADWTRGFSGWKAAFLVTEPDFDEIIGLQPKLKKPLPNSQLHTTLYVYEIP